MNKSSETFGDLRLFVLETCQVAAVLAGGAWSKKPKALAALGALGEPECWTAAQQCAAMRSMWFPSGHQRWPWKTLHDAMENTWFSHWHLQFSHGDVPAICDYQRLGVFWSQVPADGSNPWLATICQRPMWELCNIGNVPRKYGFIWYRSSILGSWNSHWSKPWLLINKVQIWNGNECMNLLNQEMVLLGLMFMGYTQSVVAERKLIHEDTKHLELNQLTGA